MNTIPSTFSSEKIQTVKKAKAFFSKQLWRMRQSSSIVNLIFYALTLAGVYLPFVENYIKINRGLLLSLLAILAASLILFLGIIYDVFLKLWKEDNTILIEKNPYSTYLFTDKELQSMKVNLSNFRATYESMRTNMLICEHLGIPCSELEEQLKDIKKKTDLFEDWIVQGRFTPENRI